MVSGLDGPSLGWVVPPAPLVEGAFSELADRLLAQAWRWGMALMSSPQPSCLSGIEGGPRLTSPHLGRRGTHGADGSPERRGHRLLLQTGCSPCPQAVPCWGPRLSHRPETQLASGWGSPSFTGGLVKNQTAGMRPSVGPESHQQYWLLVWATQNFSLGNVYWGGPPGREGEGAGWQMGKLRLGAGSRACLDLPQLGVGRRRKR